MSQDMVPLCTLFLALFLHFLGGRILSSSIYNKRTLSLVFVGLVAMSGCSTDPEGTGGTTMTEDMSSTMQDASSDQDMSTPDQTTADMQADDMTSTPSDMSTDPGDMTSTPPDDMTTTPPDDMSTMPPVTTRCGALPAPEGTIVRVTPDQADELPEIVANATTGTTILLADGVYKSSRQGESARRMNFRTPGVTMRSESGNPEAVVIDGEYNTNEIISILASDITIAELTITHAEDHLIHATGNGSEDIENTNLYRLILTDAGEQFIKVNPSGGEGVVDDGVLSCSYFELTDAGRPNIERAGGGCYTGGIDAHAVQGWSVEDNEFVGIYCAGEGLAEHAIHFWRNSRDTIVRRNKIVNCARGIGFGLNPPLERRVYDDNPYPDAGGILEHIDGVIQNNTIFADIAYYDTGIEIQHVRGARVEHNTVMSTESATGFYTSIDYRFPVTQITLRNNIARRITRRNEGNATREGNLEAPPASIFVDLASGDLHLASGASQAIDQGVMIEDVTEDIDGDERNDGAWDIGADEVTQ